MIQRLSSFQEPPQNLPFSNRIERLEMLDAAGDLVGSIEHQPGKQGALAVYLDLLATCRVLNADAQK